MTWLRQLVDSRSEDGSSGCRNVNKFSTKGCFLIFLRNLLSYRLNLWVYLKTWDIIVVKSVVDVDCCLVDIYSVHDCRLPHVLLGSTILPGLLCRWSSGRSRGLRHYGAHCRVVFRSLPSVQSGCRHVRMGTRRTRIGWQYDESLLVRSAAFRSSLRQPRSNK